MLKVVEQRFVLCSLQLLALELSQHLIVILILEQLLDPRLHQNVGPRTAVNLPGIGSDCNNDSDDLALLFNPVCLNKSIVAWLQLSHSYP